MRLDNEITEAYKGEKEMATVTGSVTIYNVLRAKQGVFSDEEAQIIAGALETKGNAATTDDVTGLELRIEKAMSGLALGIEKCCSRRG